MDVASISSSATYRAQTQTGGSDLTVNDFFRLIAAQIQNQSMYDTVDNTQFLSQLAQFSTLTQITQLTASLHSNLAISLIGKQVSVASADSSKAARTVSGTVEQVGYYNKSPYLYVNGNYYSLDEITDVGPDVKESKNSTYTDEMTHIGQSAEK